MKNWIALGQGPRCGARKNLLINHVEVCPKENTDLDNSAQRDLVNDLIENGYTQRQIVEELKIEQFVIQKWIDEA